MIYVEAPERRVGTNLNGLQLRDLAFGLRHHWVGDILDNKAVTVTNIRCNPVNKRNFHSRLISVYFMKINSPVYWQTPVGMIYITIHGLLYDVPVLFCKSLMCLHWAKSCVWPLNLVEGVLQWCLFFYNVLLPACMIIYDHMIIYFL